MRTAILLFALMVLIAAPGPAASEWRAGVGAVVITPERPMWMAGYAARKKPSEGVAQELKAKALVLEDSRGDRAVIVTSDLLGFTRTITDATARRIEARFGISRERIVFTSSHTHGGPALRESLAVAYNLDPEQAKLVREYTGWLEGRVVEAVGSALRDLSPARLSVGRGYASFAVNRRERKEGGVAIGVNREGPVNREVPVLRVSGTDGKLRAVLFGYACHNTTLQGDNYLFHGDYAGVAQLELEKQYPGATALFMIGCAADANPFPRGTMELAVAHGRELAAAVSNVISGQLRDLHGRLLAALEYAALPLTPPPSKAELEARLSDKDVYRQRNVRLQLAVLESGRSLPESYSYPIQVLRLGDTLTLVALAGEVVVDYDIRIKRELGTPENLWVVGYANDVFAYIPSRRILEEGGYEAETSMVYYGLHGPWALEIEETLIDAVLRISRRLH